MANEARLAREALVVAHHFPEDDTEARLAREALVVAHHYPETLTAALLARLAVVVAISRPHGWDIFDDPGREVHGLGDDDQGGPISGGPDDVTPPAIPTGLTVEPGDTELYLSWISNEELDLASYNVYQASAEGGPYTLVVSVDVNETLITGLTNALTYWFKVSAVDDTGNESDPSDPESGEPTAPPVGVAPPDPTGLTAEAGDTEIVLGWVSGGFVSDFSHYNVYRATATGGPYSLITTRVTPSFTDTGLTNGVDYFYVVTAEDADGNESGESNEATAEPVADTPPSGLPTPDVVFNSGNPYTAAKVTAEVAGTVFQFTATGGTSSGPRYENAVIPTKAGNKYRFDAGTVLDGNGTVPLAFAIGVNDVEIYDCEFTAYVGQNGSGNNNTKGGAAIRLRQGWKMYRPWGHHNKYSALRFDGDNIYVEGGRLNNNGQYGFAGGNCDDCEINGTEVDHNGGASTLGLGGDTGGCKIVHSERFTFDGVHTHHNIASGSQGGNGLWTDINNLDSLYDGCNVHDNDGAGIFHEVSLAFEIRNCTLTNNGQDNSGSGIHPVKANIQISNSGGGTSPGGTATGLIHDNVITVTSGSLGFYGISMFNSNHFQWTGGNISKGCLGVRNLLVENNTLNMSGSQWKAAMAITGNLPTSRSGDQFCGQQPITNSASKNVIRNNTVILTGGQHPSTPYIRAGTRISANQWLAFGYT